MAGFTEYLTQEGERMLAKMASGAKVSFTKVAYGDGSIDKNKSPRTMTRLANEVMTEKITSVSMNGKSNVVIKAFIDTSKVTDGFWLREKGIYMSDGSKEVLGIYSNKGDDAEYIEKSSEKMVHRTIRTILAVGESLSANIEVKASQYASAPILPEETTLEDFMKNEDNTKSLTVGDTIIIDKYVYTLIKEDATDQESYNCAGMVKTAESIEAAEQIQEAGTAADVMFVKEIRSELQEQIDNITFWVAGTLKAGTTSITLSNEKIKTTSMIECIVNDGAYGEMCCSNAKVESGKIILTYPKAITSQLNIRVKVVN